MSSTLAVCDFQGFVCVDLFIIRQVFVGRSSSRTRFLVTLSILLVPPVTCPLPALKVLLGDIRCLKLQLESNSVRLGEGQQIWPLSFRLRSGKWDAGVGHLLSGNDPSLC